MKDMFQSVSSPIVEIFKEWDQMNSRDSAAPILDLSTR